MSFDFSLRIDTGGSEMACVEDIGNQTYNLSQMFTLALGTNIMALNGRLAGEIVELLQKAVTHIRSEENLAAYEALNPVNGWGTHEGATKTLEDILSACKRHPKATLHIS